MKSLNETRVNSINSTKVLQALVFLAETKELIIEEVIKYDDSNIPDRAIPAISVSFNKEDTIGILDPMTGKATGQVITQDELQGILYSVYARYKDSPRVDEIIAGGGMSDEEAAANESLMSEPTPG
jgi:hypothetical protein